VSLEERYPINVHLLPVELCQLRAIPMAAKKFSPEELDKATEQLYQYFDLPEGIQVKEGTRRLSIAHCHD